MATLRKSPSLKSAPVLPPNKRSAGKPAEAVSGLHRTPTTTIRLEPEVRTALDHLSKLTRKPANKLINMLLREGLLAHAESQAKNFDALAKQLQQFRASPGAMRQAILNTAKAEAAYMANTAAADPAEGRFQPDVQPNIVAPRPRLSEKLNRSRKTVNV